MLLQDVNAQKAGCSEPQDGFMQTHEAPSPSMSEPSESQPLTHQNTQVCQGCNYTPGFWCNVPRIRLTQQPTNTQPTTPVMEATCTHILTRPKGKAPIPLYVSHLHQRLMA
jgi:hypothetical protein